jgi:hypothetical protein
MLYENRINSLGNKPVHIFCVYVLPNESDKDCTIFVAFKYDANGMIYILSFTLKVMKLFHFELHSKSFKTFTF